jgi:hypothetical protein
MAAPMPREPPVTSATRDLRSSEAMGTPLYRD